MGGSLDADTIVVTAGVTRLGEFLSIVFFVQFFENYKISPDFWLLFLRKICFYFDKKWVVLQLDDFFTNSSGHTDVTCHYRNCIFTLFGGS
jgi:hypothetical protein